MTTLQLWLAIGIPSVLIVLSWMQTNSRASRQEAISDQRHAELHALIISQVADLRAEVRSSVAELRASIAEQARETSSLKDIIYREMVALHERVTVIEARQS